MRAIPEFFGKRKRRGAGDEFYRDEIRASKASIDDVVPCNNLNFTITPHPSGYAAHLPLKGKALFLLDSP